LYKKFTSEFSNNTFLNVAVCSLHQLCCGVLSNVGVIYFREVPKRAHLAHRGECPTFDWHFSRENSRT